MQFHPLLDQGGDPNAIQALWVPGSLILSVLAIWPQICQNVSQKTHFDHFGSLGADMARMNLRKLIFTIVAGWPQIWPGWVSEGSV